MFNCLDFLMFISGNYIQTWEKKSELQLFRNYLFCTIEQSGIFQHVNQSSLGYNKQNRISVTNQLLTMNNWD